MYVFKGFTEKANKVLNAAIEFAQSLGHTYIGSEHILGGILKEGEGAASDYLRSQELNLEEFSEQLEVDIGKGVETHLSPADITPRTKRILENAVLEARRMGHNFVGLEHLILALISEKDCYAIKYLEIYNRLLSEC